MQLQNQNRLYTSTLNMLNYFLYMSVNAMNVRETWRDYQKWMDNPETQATLGTRHRKKNNNTEN